MARRTHKLDIDALQAKRYGSVARLLQDALNACRDRVLAKLAAQGHDQVLLSHSVVLRHIQIAGTSLTEVTRRAGLSRQAVAKVAAQLVSLGYLITEPDPKDLRAKVLKLTPQGIRLITDSIEIYEEFEAELAARIGRRRLEEFRRTLQEIAGPQAAASS